MQKLTPFNILVVDDEYQSKKHYIDVVLKHKHTTKRLDWLPVRILGTDTILKPGESREPSGMIAPDKVLERLEVKRWNGETDRWEKTKRIKVEDVDLVLLDYKLDPAYVGDKEQPKNGHTVLRHLLTQLERLPVFVFLSQFSPATGEGEPTDESKEIAERLVEDLRGSRVIHRFFVKGVDLDRLWAEIFDAVRGAHGLLEQVSFSDDRGDEERQGAWPAGGWGVVDTMSGTQCSDIAEFCRQQLDEPAGVYAKSLGKGEFQLSVRANIPDPDRTCRLDIAALEKLRIQSRTWHSTGKGMTAFDVHQEAEMEIDYGLTSPLIEVRDDDSPLDALEKLEMFACVGEGELLPAPPGVDSSLATQHVMGLLAQMVLPVGELDTQLRAHLLAQPQFEAGSTGPLQSLLKKDIDSLTSEVQKRLKRVKEQAGGTKLVFTVQQTELAAAGNGELIVRVQLVAKTPRTPKTNLVYLGGILEATQLLEAAESSSIEIQCHDLLGLRIGPNYELYELGLAFAPARGTEAEPRKEKLGAEEGEDIQRVLFMLRDYVHTLLADDLSRDKSIFDILGPSMVGPSSSHTCGANRIGRVARRIIAELRPSGEQQQGQVLLLSARLHNSFRKTGAGHRTLNALAAGLLHDVEQDHTGCESEALALWEPVTIGKRPENAAMFDHSAWMLDDKAMFSYQALDDEQFTEIHWAGYHFYQPFKGGADISLPEGHSDDLHENSVAVLVRALPKTPFTRQDVEKALFMADDEPEFSWSDFDLVIVGESVGGGKMRIRSLGGAWMSEHQGNFKKHGWSEIEKGRESIAVFPKKGKETPLDDSHLHHYFGMDNLNVAYPPIEGSPRPKSDVLPYYDLDTMLEVAAPQRERLLALALEYEAFIQKKVLDDILRTKIVDQAKAMRETLEASTEPFGEFQYTRNTGEAQNVTKTYRKLRNRNAEPRIDMLGSTFHHASLGAITAMTRNAFSEKILAAPTGGASGVLPGAYLAMKELLVNGAAGPDGAPGRGSMSVDEFHEQATDALLVSGFLAAITSNLVPPSGAEKGCQAETGTGAGMAAAFAAYMLGGTSKQIVNAMILAMKNSLGLVCDPIAGKVNTPCIKRNAFKSIEALLAAWLSLNEVHSFVSPSQVIRAMAQIGDDMHEIYRETSEGGLAKTLQGFRESMCKLG